ncbi:MAG TPA: sulfatase-like hydrolase/transferase [Pirellulales bacterium]|jgi:arylsulfatase A-like enzyme|nr:sulfatase-like hydrolase/transferase [Pirellulales bacterium]
MNLLVIVVDRLHKGYLGPYGNAWVGTGAFNRLAGQSFVFDHVLSDCPDLDAFYRGCWTGTHALESDSPSRPESLPLRLASAGMPMTVLYDDPQLDIAWAASSLERMDLSPATATESATTVDDTHLAEVFASTIQWLSEARGPFSLWIHTQGLGGPWDAPPDEYRNRYADEDESPPPPSVVVPRLVLPPDYDPDLLLGYCQAYAGQVRLLDDCLGGLLEWLDDSPIGSETLLMVVGARGIALGEHRRIGAWDNALHGETIRLPWLMRLGDRSIQACRTQALAQPADVFPTLLDALGLEVPSPQSPLGGRSAMPVVRGQQDTLRDRALAMTAQGDRGIRTPAWYLRIAGDHAIEGDPPGVRNMLYAMPDDRWETNDVASRCPEVVEELEGAARDVLSPLSEALTNTMR